MPPPLGVFGIKTIYLPAIEIKVVNAAPFKPLSSFRTCTRITWFGLITSWILYLLDGILLFFSSTLTWFSISLFFSLLSSLTDYSFSFIEIGNVGVNANEVTGGISEALVSTAAGLIIAIFTLVFSNYFNSLKIKKIKLINEFCGRFETFFALKNFM